MGSKKAIGLSEDGIRIADLDGLTAAPEESAYYSIGNTYKDSASLVTEEGETVECECEEFDDPEDEIQIAGSTTLQYSTSDLDPESCYKCYGGTLSTDKKKWTAPDRFEPKEVAVKYETRTGLKVTIGRAKMFTRINWEIKKNGYGLLEHKLTLLTPKIPGMKKLVVDTGTTE